MSESVTVRGGMNMVWMINDGHMIPDYECGINFLTFVLRLRKNPGRNLNQEKMTQSEIETEPARREATMLPLDHSGGLIQQRLLLRQHIH